MKMYLPLSFVVFLIAGCALPVTYVPPESGPTATLVFPAEEQSYRFLRGFSATGTSFTIKPEGKKCAPLFKAQKTGEKDVINIIPSDQTIIVMSGVLIRNKYCKAFASFVSIENHIYEVVPAYDNNKCYIRVMDTVKNKPVNLNKAYQREFELCSES